MMADVERHSITTLPDEITIRIFRCLDDHRDVFALAATCKQLYRFTGEQSIWRSLSQRWTTWRHGGHLSWKEQFRRRYEMDRLVEESMDKIINHPEVGRVSMIHKIQELGYEVRDRLMKDMETPRGAEDFLARRWWANAVMKSLNRWGAINAWAGLSRGDEGDLEDALGAFDMFVRNGGRGDTLEIRGWMDLLVAEFKEQHPAYKLLAARPLALKLAEFMNQKGFLGSLEAIDYYRVKNNFIGFAMESPLHEGLPLIYSSIYCCLARRLGLVAYPTAFPLHVFALVREPYDRDLDGKPRNPVDRPKAMYIDVFKHSNHEMPLDDLYQHLCDMNIAKEDWDEYLHEASLTDLVLRTGRNILNCLNTRRDLLREGQEVDSDDDLDEESVIYCVLWMGMVFGDADAAETLNRRRHHSNFLCNTMEQEYPWDVDKLEQIILPMFQGRTETIVLQQRIQNIKKNDKKMAEPKPRTEAINKCVKFKIGTVFKHQRYGYEAVIIGWDEECDATDGWQMQNRIERLDHGPKQPFYHCLGADKSGRYVAQENIVPTRDPPSEDLFRHSGQYFRDYSEKKREFVSNLRHCYPDD